MHQIIIRKYTIFLAVLLFLLISCKGKDNFTPKPKGYFRIELPKKEYTDLEIKCPYTFEYPTYTKILQDPENSGNNCWINIHYPSLNGDIHISYKEVNGNLQTFIEDSRTLVYKHTVRAESIMEQVYEDPQRGIYGILYELKGNVASPMQFFVTDSTNHFLRGSLYFRTEPNKDSLAPVINFAQKDIRHIIETLNWKYE